MDPRPLPTSSSCQLSTDVLVESKHVYPWGEWPRSGPYHQTGRGERELLFFNAVQLCVTESMGSQYKQQLTKSYQLRKLARAKPVMSVDDLYHILFTHWVYDDATYVDERQRVQVAAALLLAAYTGCRPCSLFDTSLKKLDNAVTSAQSLQDPQASNDTDPDIDSDSDDTVTESSSESGYDNGCDSGSAETGSIRYSDVRLFAFRPSVPGGPNLVVAKVTLLHTKGAERKAQSSV